MKVNKLVIQLLVIIYFVIVVVLVNFPELTNSVYQMVGPLTAEGSTVNEYSDVIFQVILIHAIFLAIIVGVRYFIYNFSNKRFSLDLKIEYVVIATLLTADVIMIFMNNPFDVYWSIILNTLLIALFHNLYTKAGYKKFAKIFVIEFVAAMSIILLIFLGLYLTTLIG